MIQKCAAADKSEMRDNFYSTKDPTTLNKETAHQLNQDDGDVILNRAVSDKFTIF